MPTPNPAFTQQAQFINGKQVEARLDVFFRARGWDIVQTTAHQERALCLGDRIFRRPGARYFVEYKSGIQTFYTGNIFLETVSVDTAKKPGWVFTCKADFIFYAALLNHEILVFQPDSLREKIYELRSRFREVMTAHDQNAGYNTAGVVVPLAYAEQHLAAKIIEVPE